MIFRHKGERPCSKNTLPTFSESVFKEGIDGQLVSESPISIISVKRDTSTYGLSATSAEMATTNAH